jgi:NAD(P)-dependent dehydrogenase (short-subunit alcohol dehydrogenase family)
MDLTKCSAVVSGGAGGLGGATSRRLVQLGIGIVVFDPDAEKGATLANELGERATAVQGDQNNDADVQSVSEWPGHPP